MENNSVFTVSLCILNQWALDFTGNKDRILKSIVVSKEAGARYRLGPELELTGYGCEDHFHELDTYNHAWECLADILEQTKINPKLQDIICDIGMPVLHSGVNYSSRVIILNGRILLIRPKLVLADGGLHRETRWFTAWPHQKCLTHYYLPSCVRRVAKDNQAVAHFGDALLRFVSDSCDHVVVGLETCEELWIGSPPHMLMFSSGADVVLNASASHHELRKLSKRIELVEMASRSCGGGMYAYTNLRGCDSGRICYDGGAMAAVSGRLVFLSKQFSFDDIEVNTVAVDLSDIRSRRIISKRSGVMPSVNAALTTEIHTKTGYPVVDVFFPACGKTKWSQHNSTGHFAWAPVIHPVLLKPEEEIAQGPALWLWDMLRRTGSSGFFLCLSGGLDSASVACLVLSLANQLYNAIAAGNDQVTDYLQFALGKPSSVLCGMGVRELCTHLLFTCYMPSTHSSSETANRAALLAEAIGSHHLIGPISETVSSLITTAMQSLCLSEPPRFTTHGGTPSESLALQNVQARTRMVLGYLLAQLIPSCHGRSRGLIVLGSANLDETLLGYCTKYDCSSADLNPIGSISKADLREFLRYCTESLTSCLPLAHQSQFRRVLMDTGCAQPTAELMPLTADGHVEQTDEADMGLTYGMLSLFGRLRKLGNCGPYSMLRCLLNGAWADLKKDLPEECVDQSNGEATPELARFLADKVKHFFRSYSKNRHKTTILTPSYHAEGYSADDNRFDLRPFLYPVDWTHQFTSVDTLVTEWEAQFT